MTEFLGIEPSSEDYLRAIVLLGRNVACYKFPLTQAIIELGKAGKTVIPLEELALPYFRPIAEHLKQANKQTTSTSSRFLESCSQFNEGKIDLDRMIQLTVRLGFENVLEAFHNLPSGEIPKPFFDHRGWRQKKIITLTDEFGLILESQQLFQLDQETKARWRAVEMSWDTGISRNLLSVEYDEQQKIIFALSANRRIDVTSCRDSLNGYQKGKCFYCFRPISIFTGTVNLSDVDHFFPHMLSRFGVAKPINGVWNLVLSCSECNRGRNGKFERLVNSRYLKRLHKRNEYLIKSNHLLKKALIEQTGLTSSSRKSFLVSNYDEAKRVLATRSDQTWETVKYDVSF